MTSRPPQPKPTGASMRAGWLIWVAGAAIVVIGVVLCAARYFAYSRLPVVEDVVALRNALTVGAAFLAVALGGVCVVWVRRRVQLGIVAASLALVTIVSGTGILSLGLANDSPALASDGDVRVLSWNINGDLVTAERVAAVASASGANNTQWNADLQWAETQCSSPNITNTRLRGDAA
ncbi:hypothetical protein [Subtercola endophyticus]|uniref:hypothetical protein n=1 Tax=Subtercola endophyticus TaxID=2895559 RepID=UPI001E5803AF|nr:hypothetical protein [Subtercola endophyticus]UFS60901.1 hypothetical protein LQ955_09285 [Subtercola endophyticus]